MKIVIELASHDSKAISNYRALSERIHSTMSSNDYFQERLDYDGSKLLLREFKNKQFVPKISEWSTKISLAQKAETTVDFIAHGNEYVSDEILILPLRLKNTPSPSLAHLKPKDIADFFIANATQDNQLKFQTLNLFVCRGYEFGRKLSELLRDVNIICFKEDITINDKGIACVKVPRENNEPTSTADDKTEAKITEYDYIPAKSYTFINGDAPEIKSENQATNQPMFRGRSSISSEPPSLLELAQQNTAQTQHPTLGSTVETSISETDRSESEDNDAQRLSFRRK